MAITDADLTDLLPEVDVEALIGQCYTPFSSDKIKIRQDAGTGNKPLSYVGHPDYTRRLDALFPFAWSFHTEVAGLNDTQVAIKGSLSITLEDGRTITRENFGNGSINRGFPLGDAMKVAAVDALKKCCSTFGIGLHLYDGDTDLDNRASPPNNGGNGRASTNGHYEPPPFSDDLGHDYQEYPDPPPREQKDEHRYDTGNDPSPATSRQIIALQNIAKSNKTDPGLANEIKTILSKPVEKDGPPRVSKAKASEMISRAFDK